MNPLKTFNEQILERILSPNATFQEVVNLVSKDAKLTQQILRVANSNYYAVAEEIAEVGRALQYLGVQTLAVLILTCRQ